jgi:hypothetical protein
MPIYTHSESHSPKDVQLCVQVHGKPPPHPRFPDNEWKKSIYLITLSIAKNTDGQ